MFADYSSTELMSIFAMQGFAGLSLFSVFVLMAMGLAIIFGQMGVINMAHGELMMIGAYATYEVQNLFGHSLPDHPANWYFVAALPAAFLSAALVLKQAYADCVWE